MVEFGWSDVSGFFEKWSLLLVWFVGILFFFVHPSVFFVVLGLLYLPTGGVLGKLFLLAYASLFVGLEVASIGFSMSLVLSLIVGFVIVYNAKVVVWNDSSGYGDSTFEEIPVRRS